MRKKIVVKNDIYENFFKVPFIERFCDQHGIDVSSDEGAKRRCPLLLNILESIGIITQKTREIEIEKFMIGRSTLSLIYKEEEINIERRISKVYEYYKNGQINIEKQEISLLKEAFGKEFLTEQYFLKDYEKISSSKASRVLLANDDYTFARRAA